ncbi:PEP-CTERM sorting domain-containing protein [Duganella sp. HSC-15S17]|nr:PEP-CTERM sorting domain-containing protein [Duganella violaceicalia]
MHENIAVQSAVPEADTYAMLLAGLGIMGVVARRRGRCSPAVSP